MNKVKKKDFVDISENIWDNFLDALFSKLSKDAWNNSSQSIYTNNYDNILTSLQNSIDKPMEQLNMDIIYNIQRYNFINEHLDKIINEKKFKKNVKNIIKNTNKQLFNQIKDIYIKKVI